MDHTQECWGEKNRNGGKSAFSRPTRRGWLSEPDQGCGNLIGGLRVRAAGSSAIACHRCQGREGFAFETPGSLLSDYSKHSCTRKAKVGCKHSEASICGCRQKFSPKVIPQQVRGPLSQSFGSLLLRKALPVARNGLRVWRTAPPHDPPGARYQEPGAKREAKLGILVIYY